MEMTMNRNENTDRHDGRRNKDVYRKSVTDALAKTGVAVHPNVRVLANKPVTGDVLPNGAVVVDAAEGRDSGVVLARVSGPQAWVTWRYPKGRLEATGSGRYWDTLAEAVADYDSRKPLER